MRKIYVMAHRCNTKKWLDHAIQWEANGIECDVVKDDGKFYTWHGDIVAAGSEELDVYLDHACVKLQSGKGSNVSLFLFDLKYDNGDKIKASDINYIRQKVQEKLLLPINSGLDPEEPGGLYAFYGIYEGASYAGEFEQAMTDLPLKSREGVNYDAGVQFIDPGNPGSTSPSEALKWKEDHNVSNFFYSAGIFAGHPGGTMWKWLEEAGELRPDNAFGVYGWTFNRAQSAADTVKKYKIDGVLGNMDQNYGWLPTYLDYYGLESYSLVSRDDMPPFLETISS